MAETPTHYVYLSPGQVKVLREHPLFDGEHSVSIGQADLLHGGEWAGDMLVSEPGSARQVFHFDHDGNLVHAPEGGST
jgi:hypothetical protein